MLYSKTTGGFYRNDDLNVPEDVVSVLYSDYKNLLELQCDGYEICSDSLGRPVAVKIEPELLTPSDHKLKVENLRKRAYANSINGSDRFFVEAQRMQFMGEEGWEIVRDMGVTRYNEIKNEYPLTQ